MIDTPYKSIIFMGKGGCGKGTQATRLSKELSFDVFSTGDRVRSIGTQDTPLGRRIQEIQVAGWVPEWLATYLFVKVILEEDFERGLIFESVARKPEEAVRLHEMHTMLERPYIVIHLDASDEVVRERMLKRQRDGADLEENIERRIKAFYDETMKSLQYFAEHVRVVRIDADQEAEVVYSDILKAITTTE